MITAETFFWFYSTMAQVAATITTLIGVFIITYYSIIKSKQLDKIRDEKYKIEELTQISGLGLRLSFLFKDKQGLFLNEPTNSKEAEELLHMAKTKDEAITAFKEIYSYCFPMSFEKYPPPSDSKLDDYQARLITFHNTLLNQDLVKYLREDNHQLTGEKIGEAKREAQDYLKLIREIKDIRREINQNKFENHFPNQKEIWEWISLAFMVGIITPLLLLLILERFSINELMISSLIAASMLVAFVYALFKAASIIIKDVTSERIEAMID